MTTASEAVAAFGAGESPAWSPDGGLAFVHARIPADTTTYGIWYVPDPLAQDAVAQMLIEPGGRAAGPRWSPDGTHLIFQVLTSTGSHLMVTSRDGDRMAPVGGPKTGYVLDFAYAPR